MIEHRRLRSFDGTEIAYQVCGEGPAVVLANGLGAHHNLFGPLFQGLGDHCRVLSWDYRGMHASAAPKDAANLTVAHHCDDLAHILRHEGIGRCVLCGWSMGVQVCLEFTRHRQHLLRGIVAICGATGRTGFLDGQGNLVLAGASSGPGWPIVHREPHGTPSPLVPLAVAVFLLGCRAIRGRRAARRLG